MNRLFGKGKPKEPPANLNDCVANVSCMFCQKMCKLSNNSKYVPSEFEYMSIFNLSFIRLTVERSPWIKKLQESTRS